MTVISNEFPVQTRGHTDILDITRQVEVCLADSGLQDGVLVVFSPSSTSSVTTIEYEPGCLSDLQRLFDEIAPSQRPYAHDARWGDGNGFSHIRAALLGPSLSIPFRAGKLILGTWQQIIFVDFDNRSRRREIIVQMVGE
jgi:secondary thiamine-phosphate synthase enzyme